MPTPIDHFIGSRRDVPALMQALQIEPYSLAKQIEDLQAIAPNILLLSQQLKLTNSQDNSEPILQILWDLWLPLAQKISHEARQKKQPFIQGILGVQGTGKTTLTKILQNILQSFGQSSVTLSIDDFYKTHAERQDLKQCDRRLIWRGPPGTHDVKLALETLEQLQQRTLKIAIPRFDKSLHNGDGDRLPPEIIQPVDIILFEGWFLGMRPISASNFTAIIPPINTPEDQQFARDINQALSEYLPLWEKLDRLLILYPKDYRFSKQWRKQAEKQMIAQGKAGMSDLEIEQFVDYFWRSLHPELFLKPLIADATYTDLVIELNGDRSLGHIYSCLK